VVREGWKTEKGKGWQRNGAARIGVGGRYFVVCGIAPANRISESSEGSNTARDREIGGRGCNPASTRCFCISNWPQSQLLYFWPYGCQRLHCLITRAPYARVRKTPDKRGRSDEATERPGRDAIRGLDMITDAIPLHSTAKPSDFTKCGTVWT